MNLQCACGSFQSRRYLSLCHDMVYSTIKDQKHLCATAVHTYVSLCVIVTAQAVFHTAILNDTLFLNIVNIVDYSIVVGLDEERRELVSTLCFVGRDFFGCGVKLYQV